MPTDKAQIDCIDACFPLRARDISCLLRR